MGVVSKVAKKKGNSMQRVKDSPHLGLKIHKATYHLGPHATKGSLSLGVKLADLISQSICFL